MNNIDLIIGGDTFLGRRVEPVAIKNPELLISEEIRNLFMEADFKVINLESPLTQANEKDRIMKTGPNLKADPATIKVLTYLQIDLVTLANNHIYDYGDKGLRDTLRICALNKIDIVGAGTTLQEASKYYIKNIKGKKVAFLNIAENEWCNADIGRGGANPMNIIDNCRAIQEAKKNSDVVILIIHGGHEQYYFPSPRMVEQYRFYAEQGASLIVNHHSHCISGYEIYNKVPIYYGLGNFIFDSDTKFEGWYEGALLSASIDSNDHISCKLIPYEQGKVNHKVKLLKNSHLSKFEEKIKSINLIIAKEDLLKNEFNQFVDIKTKFILENLSTSFIIDHKLFRSGIRKLGLEKFFLRKKQLQVISNYARCEAHREIVLKTLDNLLTD